jgi:hypothetical protein
MHFDAGLDSILGAYAWLAGRPMQMTSAHDMQMQMKDLLAGIGAAINHCAIPIFSQTGMASDLFCGKQELSGQQLVICTQIIQRGDMLFRYYQHMYRRAWAHIVKCQYQFIFKNNVGFDFTCDHFAKNTI